MAAFVIPEAGAPFEFEHGGEAYAVPYLIDLDADEFDQVMDKLAESRGDNRRSVMVAREVIERHAPGSTKGLTYAQLGALADAWASEGGEDLGEDGSSSE